MSRNTKNKKEITERNADREKNENTEDITNTTIYQKLSEMQKSLEFLSEKFDEIQKENAELRNILKEQKKCNKMLEEKVNTLEKIIDRNEREAIQNDLVICGISKDQAENITETTKKIFKKLSSDFNDDEIKNCYWKHQNQENNSIVVTLKNKEAREKILKARKTVGSLQTKECQIIGRNNNLYINEHLTTLAGQLFYAARNSKKEKKVKYAWVRDGNVYVRKTENSEKIRLTQLTDIEQI